MDTKQIASSFRFFRHQTWFELLGIFTLLAMSGLAFIAHPTVGYARWIMLGVFLMIIVIQAWPLQICNNFWKEHLRLILLLLLSFVLVWLDTNFTAVVILYFVLSGHAMQVFPPRTGYLWILLLGVISTGLLTILLYPEWPFGLFNGLGVTGGYFFIGSSADAQRRADEARMESQRLLAELQTAHQQLQASAAHTEALAVSEERNRLAREMHDTLGHRLTVAAVQLEGARKLISRDPEKATRMVSAVHEQVLEGLTELRGTVAALRTPLEDQLPLRAALTRLITNFTHATSLKIELQLPDTLPDLPASHRQTIYRAVQEALTNVQRHAQAHQVNINFNLIEGNPNLQETPDCKVRIAIEDDGIGMPSHTLGSGFGLRGLRERTEQLGGGFSIERASLGGIRLVINLPLPLPKVTYKEVS